mgnify:FL=1|jgi:CMP-N-acetylneuraminic acid synthetase|tara:strand:+ start:5482 stop:6189 length:708 start_codon:yes stop_codon:yes gene_type:complete
MKNIKDVCFIIQTRLSSLRCPQKAIRPFADTTLTDIAIQKILKSKVIPKENFYASVYEKELLDLCDKYDINIYYRSEESANSRGNIGTIVYEWYNRLPYEYCVLISTCQPLMKIETIDSFVKAYLETESDGLFAVVPKKQYYWNNDGDLISPWPEGCNLMNTNVVEPTFEAAHCLYASRMDAVGNGMFMGKPPYTKNNPDLFSVEELEVFDVDHEWEFEVAEILYRKFRNDFNIS